MRQRTGRGASRRAFPRRAWQREDKQLAAAKTPQEQTMLQRQIDATDRQIDRLVYELYGLTDAEIKIVEAASS
jgi:predicted  nucleic acid-binding Zn-ribbon protein